VGFIVPCVTCGDAFTWSASGRWCPSCGIVIALTFSAIAELRYDAAVLADEADMLVTQKLMREIS
jgi:hypothetical protein